MEKFPLVALLALVVVFSLTKYGHGLQCFVCNSAYDVGCNSSPPLPKFLKTCSETNAQPVFPNDTAIGTATTNATKGVVRTGAEGFLQEMGGKGSANISFISCRKVEVFIPDQVNGNGSKKSATRRVLRSCGWVGKGEEICRLGSSDGEQQLHCACSADACNKGETRAVFSNLAGLILMGILRLV